MKKAISVILAVILAFSVLSVSAFAEEPNNPLVLPDNYLENGIKVKITIFDDIEPIEQIIAYKDNKFSLLVKIYNQDFKVIIKENTLYLYPLKFPFIHIATKINMEEIYYDFNENITADADFVDSYVFDDYTVYEYVCTDKDTNQNIKLKYYVDDNNKLVKVESIESEYQYTIMEILETELSDSEFDLPIFSFNLTPILEFLMDTDFFIF